MSTKITPSLGTSQNKSKASRSKITSSNVANISVICVKNGEFASELHVGKVYLLEQSEPGDPETNLRIIDESGESYLYPAAWFEPVQVSNRAIKLIRHAQKIAC